MWKEFKQFAVRGSVIDMAVGIIIGAAFTSVVQSMVSDMLMPPIGLLAGGIDFSQWFFVLQEGAKPGPYLSLQEATSSGAVTLNIGTFLSALFTFLLVAFAVFLLVKSVNRWKERHHEKPEPAAPASKKCPYCFTEIHKDATRCPNCTSDV